MCAKNNSHLGVAGSRTYATTRTSFCAMSFKMTLSLLDLLWTALLENKCVHIFHFRISKACNIKNKLKMRKISTWCNRSNTILISWLKAGPPYSMRNIDRATNQTRNFIFEKHVHVYQSIYLEFIYWVCVVKIQKYTAFKKVPYSWESKYVLVRTPKWDVLLPKAVLYKAMQ